MPALKPDRLVLGAQASSPASFVKEVVMVSGQAGDAFAPGKRFRVSPSVRTKEQLLLLKPDPIDIALRETSAIRKENLLISKP